MSKLSREAVAEFAAIKVVISKAPRDAAVQEVINNDEVFQDEGTRVLGESGLDWDSAELVESLTDTSEYDQPKMPSDSKKIQQIMAVRKELLEDGTVDKFYVDDLVYERVR
ncbi:hypothetical protein [Psychrobacter aquaticus]|uniref:Uncharacterized protein n=1 Tax=Psychrobacter aquaticus CMS 56 TaxID=1354303 RepID=U4TCF8_9GAMM|nr:hypothetical protein [Psychrobacter aquaticus]ERL56148.1 hypothetical protein M917_0826 [Psychrobacter aquaticus CMS 56]